MIRQPSTFSDIYRWHRAAVAGEVPPTHDGLPEAGWFKRRMIKDGPWVPVRIYLDRQIDTQTGDLIADEFLRIEIEGIEVDDPAKHWTFLKPISRAEFDHLMDYRLRDTRMLDPYRTIDLSEQPTPPQGVY